MGGGGREGRGCEGMEEGVRGMWGLGRCVVRLILCWVLGEREVCNIPCLRSATSALEQDYGI